MKPKLALLTLVAIAGMLAAGLAVEAQRPDRRDGPKRNPIPGLERTRTVSRAVAGSEPVYILADCEYTIVDVGPDRGKILLDECTGDTWWYDNGWNAGTLGTHFGEEGTPGSYAREAEWRLISREGAE